MKYISHFRPVLLTSSILVLCLFFSYIAYFDASRLVVWSKQYEGEIAFGSHKDCFYVYNDKSISCLDLDYGSIIWQKALKENLCSVELAITSKKQPFVIFNDLHYLYCLDAINGHMLWKTKETSFYQDDEGNVIFRKRYYKTFFTDKINDVVVTQNKDNEVVLYEINNGKMLATISNNDFNIQSNIGFISELKYSRKDEIVFTAFGRWIAYDFQTNKKSSIEGDIILFKEGKLFVAKKDKFK